MPAVQWRWASASDLGPLVFLLKSHESIALSIVDRLFEEGESRLECRTRSPFWYRDVAVLEERGKQVDPEQSLKACVYFGQAGLILFHSRPEIGNDVAAARLLRLAPKKWDKVYCFMGPAAPVVGIQVELGRIPISSTGYWLLARACPQSRRPDTHWPPESGEESSWRGVELRRARPQDLNDLFEIQCMYEIEEVLAPGHRLVPAHTRVQLGKSLATQCVYLADASGIKIAKAATNGIAWTKAQIGGVFTLPEWRSKGIGEQLMKAVLRDIFSHGLGASLFVKKHNAPALRLYEKLGFVIDGELVISYYDS